MSRFMLASMAAHGHVGPLIPVASELVARGHDVDWYTGEKVLEKVQATGARYRPHVNARDLDADAFDAEFPERARKKGLARFRFDMREIFIAAVPGQVADLETYIEQARPDVIVAEPAMAGAAQVIEQRHGIPYATVGIGPLMMRSADTAPFGLGLQPPRSRIGRLRNRVLDAIIQRTLFAPIDRDYRAMTERMGIGYTRGGVFDAATSPYLFLHPSRRSSTRAATSRRRSASSARCCHPLPPASRRPPGGTSSTTSGPSYSSRRALWPPIRRSCCSRPWRRCGTSRCR